MAMWGEDDSFDGAFTFGSVAKPKKAVKNSVLRVVARTEECVKSNAVKTEECVAKPKNAVKSNAKKDLKDGGVAGKRGMSPERGNARKRSRVSSSPRGQM